MRPAAVLTSVATAIALAGCGGSQPAASTTSSTTGTAPPTTTASTTTTPPPTTAPTTAYTPSTPEASAAAAAARLLATWQAGDRVSAAMVATPSAVTALFAAPPKGLQARGCSSGTPPVDCVYADRSSSAGALYDLSVAEAPGGRWYVTSVAIETP